jgi:ATP-dependent RNA helicase RhlE
VHRIGRTGRAEQTGDAFTLMVAEDAAHVHAIERFIGRAIERTKLENFNYKYTALFEEKKAGTAGQAPVKMRGVRLSGGYYFGPAKRRRR